MRRLFLATALWIAIGLTAIAQVTFTITEVPGNTPAGATIYAAGNFNGWDEGASDFALAAQPDGTYTLTFEPEPGTLMFKFTRGSWATVEGNADGGFLPNRSLEYPGGVLEVDLEILSWEGDSPGNSTAADNVTVIAEDFYMPQLDRDRRIWVYLPPDYNSSTATYPVLYMQDGQNLFDAATAAFGEWEVDESLNTLFEEGDAGVIVVGIDNGGSSRLDEYSPWVNPSYGGGEGDAYVDFIVETLKPYIDAQYRTRPERDFTGIMGSSMGGLISLYAAIEHQDVFSKAGVFSASFWFADECYAHVGNQGKQEDMRIYMIAGEQEGSSEQQVVDMLAMEQALLAAGFSVSEINTVGHPDGTHSEWYWRREFPPAYEWLFAAIASDLQEGNLNMERVEVYPNPGSDTVEIRWDSADPLNIRVFTMQGKQVRLIQPEGQQMSLTGLPAGTYLIGFYLENGQCVGTKRLIQK
ncbi:MAG: alpha/beta hydrolase-fold protein [Phaeodactylibacter sp.]|uniref:alpha/beta hydrolase-fold protein n=1 Tax=Phaeodactylibacter sp. TaxID=1940289 RepID=UPI0032ED9E84